MVESPYSKDKQADLKEFSKPPSGSALSTVEMTEMVAGHKQVLAKAADVIGGQVDRQSELKEPIKDPAADIPVKERRDYIRSLLSNERFTKTYLLFGDNFTVIFRTRKVSENQTIDFNLSKSSGNYRKVQQRRRLAVSFVSLRYSSGRTIEEAAELDQLDDIAYAAILQAFQDFERLCDGLFTKANDPNFWTGTGGAT